MKEKVYVKDNNLVIEVPLKTQRINPYDETQHEEMDNIIGLVESDTEKGFCFRIDMDYKGKDDQWTDYFYKTNMEDSEFIELCNELGVAIVFDKKDTK